MLKAIDFFCGSGGMTYGLSKAGIKVLAGIDIAPDCRETYELNNPGSMFIQADIKRLPVKKLADLTWIKKDDDNLIFIGCSPCQYWSKINTDRSKSSATKNLLNDFKKFIDYYNPGYIIVENVPGILQESKGSILPDFITFLHEKSYRTDYDVVNASYYGVPQLRKRFLLVASRVNKYIKLPPKIIADPPKVKDFIGSDKGFAPINAGVEDHSDFMHTTSKLSKKNLIRIKVTPHNGGTRHAWKDDPELQIEAYKDKDHIFRDVYGRMYWHRPAPTLTTRFLSISNGRFGHPDEDRGISLREGATLQTFPKSYIFRGPNQASIARQIGNAVPPELAKQIGKSIIDYSKKASKATTLRKQTNG